MKKIKLLIFLFVFIAFGITQTKANETIIEYTRTIKLSELFNEAINCTDKFYNISNAIIEPDSGIYTLPRVFTKSIYISNCKYNATWIPMIENMEFKKFFSIFQVEGFGAVFTKCKFENGVRLNFSVFPNLIFQDCQISGRVSIFNSGGIVEFSTTTFTYSKTKRDSGKNILDHLDINPWHKTLDKLVIQNCVFKDTGKTDTLLFTIEGNYGKIKIHENVFNGILIFEDVNVESSVSIEQCEFKYPVGFHDAIFPEAETNIRFDQIENSGIAIYVDNFSKPYQALEGDQISDTTLASGYLFNRLISIYSKLFKSYQFRGDRASANACYAEMKQVETRRWKYLYQQNKSFERFFRWQLNAFLSYFTDYGTNPAKAVIKSAWVILLFAIFYLFFPSDWDISNRSQLLAKVKDLASKNREKSFMATLAFVLYSGFIHILNALTLSLNAFTTLGFGDIPTRGAARYVTIVQGFIGWFLLTIFSVSLINQVLG